MIYVACDCDVPKTASFFPSLHLMRYLHFEGSSLLSACYVFAMFLLSPPLIQIQTITRRAVIPPASGMSENLLLISHIKKKRKDWGFVLWLFGSTQMELWLRLIRRQCNTHYCMKYHCRKHNGRQEGDLSLWLLLIQARGSTMGLQMRLCYHTWLIYSFHSGCCCVILPLNFQDTSQMSAWLKWWMTLILSFMGKYRCFVFGGVCILFLWGHWRFLKCVTAANQIEINKLSIFLSCQLSRGHA